MTARQPPGPGGDDQLPIWRPDPATAASSVIARFGRFVAQRHRAEFDGYRDLWRWSVDQLEDFWAAVWDFFDIEADGSHAEVLADDAMPGARRTVPPRAGSRGAASPC